MRKDLSSKYEQHRNALEGHGVILNRFKGLIYRLAVAPDGWCRVCVNRCNWPQQTVLGCPIEVYDFKTPGEAIKLFNSIKENTGNYWMDYDQGRLFYDPGADPSQTVSW